MAPEVGFRVVAYDAPESVRFVDAAQAFYVERYGGVDRTPVAPDEFAPPRGLFLLGDLPDEDARGGGGRARRAVCCGGWRRYDATTIAVEDRAVLRDGDAEVKRMWVEPAYRRRGLARALLAELERTATVAGCARMVLETGEVQSEATAFYRAMGYVRIPGFGIYREAPGSLCFARALGS